MKKSKQKPKIRYVTVKQDDGTFSKISYSDLKEHSELIILDNIFFGYKLLSQGGIEEKEINKYENEARHELKQFLRRVRENEEIVIRLNPSTELYEIVEDNESAGESLDE